MRVDGNILGLKISHRLEQTSRAISRALQRLSSGSRLSSPGDDLASFSMGVKLDSRIRGLRQANLNINQGAALLQTAETGVSQQIDIVQRMRELLVEASSGSLSSQDRQNINQEVNSLIAQLQSVANNTEFNGMKLLNGGTDSLQILLSDKGGDYLSLHMQNTLASHLFTKQVPTGEFNAARSQQSTTSSYFATPTIADLNGDGLLDIITLDSNSNFIEVQLNQGDGEFSITTTFASDDRTNAFEIGDFNNDGILDLVSADDTNQTLSLYAGNGDGSFQSRTTISVGGNSGSVRIADVDNDGINDIVATDYQNEYVVTFLGTGNGNFSSAITASAVGLGTLDSRLADLDGDGNIDFVGSDGSNVKVMFGDGTGSFSGLTTYAQTTTITDIHLSDIDHDGDLDLITSEIYVLGNDNISVRLNNGDGTFTAATTYLPGDSVASPRGHSTLADFNGDGYDDIIMANDAASSLSIFINDGTGNFSTRKTISESNPGNLAVGDLNNDGAVDIASFSIVGGDIHIYDGKVKPQSAVSDFAFSSAEEASALIQVVDDAMDKLLNSQAEIASNLHRLEIASSYNLLTAESYEEAKSRITDVDLTIETTNLVTSQILQQAQVAALAQANTNLQIVLQLFDF